MPGFDVTMRTIGYYHWTQKTLNLHGALDIFVANEYRLGPHPFPTPFLCFRSRIYDSKHFFFTYAFHFGQRHSMFGGLFIPLVLDAAGQRFCVVGLPFIQQVLRQRYIGLDGSGSLGILLFFSPYGLLYLDFLLMASDLPELRTDASQVLRLLGDLMGFARGVVQILESVLGYVLRIVVISNHLNAKKSLLECIDRF